MLVGIPTSGAYDRAAWCRIDPSSSHQNRLVGSSNSIPVDLEHVAEWVEVILLLDHKFDSIVYEALRAVLSKGSPSPTYAFIIRRTEVPPLGILDPHFEQI